MPLTLIVGRANSGRTGVVNELLHSAAKDRESCALLVPSRPDVARAVQELAGHTPTGISVTQFGRYLERQWALGGDGRRLVSPTQRSLLMRIAAGSCGTRLTGGGHRRLLERLALLSADRASAEVLGDLRADGVTAELIDVLREYRSALADKGLVEPGEAYGLLPEGRPPSGEGVIVAHRFTDLSCVQEACLTGWARAGVEVIVTLPWEDGCSATACNTELVRRLLRHDSIAHVQKPDSAWYGSEELVAVEERLFGGPAGIVSLGHVGLVTAQGPEAEAEGIATHVASLAAEYGEDRVAVVFRNPREHDRALRAAFRFHGIAADYDYTVPFERTSLGEALGHLLSFFDSRCPRERITAFLRGPFCPADLSRVDDLDARWRRERVDDRHVLLRQAQQRLGAATRTILTSADALAKRPISDDSIGDWHELLGELIRAGQQGGGASDPQAEASDGAAQRAVAGALSEIADLREQGIRGSDLPTVLGEMTVAPGETERPGHVQVLAAGRLPSRRFDAVVVGGMTESGFDCSRDQEPADAILRGLLGPDVRLDPSSDDEARERLLFYQVATRARSRLVLTRQEIDSEGRPVPRSVLWDAVLDLYREPSSRDDAEASGPQIQRIGFSDVLAYGASRATPGETPSRCLLDPDVLRGIRSLDAFSVTELETYARCPFRWMYEKAVHPRRLDAAIGPPEAGSVAHSSLQSFYAGIRARLGVDRVDTSCIAEAIAFADECWAQAASVLPPTTDVLEGAALDAARDSVRRMVAADATFLVGFEPVELELRFGVPGGGDAVDLGGFRAKGSIDRVDAVEEGIVVIDYKTGVAKPHARFDRDGILQLPLYAAAAAALTGKTVVGAFHRSLREGADRGFFIRGCVPPGTGSARDAVDADGFKEIVETAVERAREAACGIREGRTAPRPLAPQVCLHCPASAVCGSGPQ